MDGILSLWVFALSLLFRAGVSSFPDNISPICMTSIQDVPTSVFKGGEGSDVLRSTQDLKMVKVAGMHYYAITGREKLFLVRPDNFSPKARRKIPHSLVYTWKSDEKAKNLCVMKGQSEENCENYIRVLEQMDGNGNKFLVCATNSYNPRCMYITASLNANKLMLEADEDTFSGAEKCSFGPGQTGVNLYIGNSLYSATVSEFSGRSYAISRSLGKSKQLKTPKFDSKVLNEPYFVKMMNDGERILIFMNEMVRSDNGDVRMVAYVAQVCKNDVGGQHVLMRQWTKFEKSRLNCSLNGFYFDQLQDVSDVVDVRTTPESDDTVKTIYATFTTPDYSVPGSAVCAFTIHWIHEALLGRFRQERGKGGAKSSAPSGDRHPGNCPDNQYTESELLFLKSHPLLEDQARGSLLITHVGERWTSIAVDPFAGPQKNWTVFFVGTSTGHLLRYLQPTVGLKRSVFLRRQEAFDRKRCYTNASETEEKSVTRIVVDSERDQIIITFKHCVITIPLRSCSIHKCKRSCIASADPYCGWNGTHCIDYILSSVNVEQRVFSEARHPALNIHSLCLDEEKHSIWRKQDETLEPVVTSTDADNTNGQRESDVIVDFNAANGTFIETRSVDGGVLPHSRGSEGLFKDGYVNITLTVGIAVAAAALFFVVGLFTMRKCCPITKNDVQKRSEGMDGSKNSIANPGSLCKRLITRISPNKKCKAIIRTPCLNHTEKGNNKLDEFHKQENGLDRRGAEENLLLPPENRYGCRLNGSSSSSQVADVLDYNKKGLKFAQSTSPTSSMTATGRQYFSTAPRSRQYSGNRASDPSDYSNAPTLRAEKGSSRVQSRHSTPVPQLPTTPTSKEFAFQFDQVIEKTDHILYGVSEVIQQQERRSQEMETVVEEYDESRARHDSSDSGKGTRSGNSDQTENQDKIATLNRVHPDNIQINVTKGRKRLHSEPTSPTMSHPSLQPLSNHKSVGRSTSMRAEHAMSVPSYVPRKRSGSFSHQSQPSTPMGKASPPRMKQVVQSGFQPQAQPNIYATLPTNAKLPSGHPQMENYSRQQSYDAYSPHNRHPLYDQREMTNHPAMVMPDRYSSLPLRSRTHRSNKKSFASHYVPKATQMNRRNSATARITPSTQQQMSSPASYDQQRMGQRPRYVPTPTVPGYPATVPEQDAV